MKSFLLSLDYEILLFTDGSGSTAETPCGWSFISLNRNGETRQQSGYLSNGTVNQSELMGLVQFLMYCEATKTFPKKILVVSDSELTVKCGNKEWSINHNKGIWSLIDYHRLNNCQIDFVWVPRNSNDLSKIVDKESKEIRLRKK